MNNCCLAALHNMLITIIVGAKKTMDCLQSSAVSSGNSPEAEQHRSERESNSNPISSSVAG